MPLPALLLLSLLLAACAGSLRYTADYPLGTEKTQARSGLFTARVPRGWFSSSDDTLSPTLEAWLVRDDFSATLAVRELLLDQRTIHSVRKEGLELLASIDAGLRRGPDPSLAPGSPVNGEEGAVPFAADPKVFEMSGRTFCAYEIREGIFTARVVVFEAGGKYYECEARPVKGIWTREDRTLLFSAQQAFLSTMSF